MPPRCPGARPLSGTYTQDHPLARPVDLQFPSPALINPPGSGQHGYIFASSLEAGLHTGSTSSGLYTHFEEEAIELPSQTWIIRFGQYILSAVCMIYTMGLYRLYYKKFRFQESDPRTFDSSEARWANVVQRMVSLWELARIGCGVLLPLSIALLQIDGVINTVLARTCAITISIFAAAGLLSSGIYLFLRNELKNTHNATRWIEASQRSYALKSVEFWTYLALPFASLIWAILTCAVSVMCIAWTNRAHSEAEEPESAFIASATFITCLIAIKLVYLYKAAGMIIRY